MISSYSARGWPLRFALEWNGTTRARSIALPVPRTIKLRHAQPGASSHDGKLERARARNGGGFKASDQDRA